jgi:Leucine-rich repeat (LRR) protein
VVHSGSHFKHCGDLRELNGLNKLRGSLRISNLGCGKDVALELKTVMLKEKQHLRDLSLKWSTEGDVNDWDVVDDKMPLEGFQPLPNLKRLCLDDYPGSRLPSWVFSLTNLVELWLFDCRTLKSIPEWIHNFKSLEDFRIDGCSSLTSLPEGMGRLTSLKNGCSFELPEGMGSQLNFDLERVNDEDGMQGQGLTSLLSLHFSGLPKLVSLPSALQHATSLQHLEITDCESLAAIPEWIHNFKSLEDFEIDGCSSLTSLPEGMGRLTSLKSLTIRNCFNLERVNDEDGMQGQGLTSLLNLHFSGLPKLVSLPSALQHATSLQNLKITDCESLAAIPEWIHNFKSLEDFKLMDAPV